MASRSTAMGVISLLLAAAVGASQTAAEVLQKGIYTQETVGDVDASIEIYRRVIDKLGADHALAARGQMQLVKAFLQKGDVPGATREFDILQRRYSDQKEVVSAASAAIRWAIRPIPAKTGGSSPRSRNQKSKPFTPGKK